MAASIVYRGRFEHSAFVWPLNFAKPQVGSYQKEDRFAIREEDGFENSVALSSDKVLERFIFYKCDGDKDRYLYRNNQIKNFFRGLNLEDLRQGSEIDIKGSLALIREYPISNISCTNMSERERSQKPPMNAYDFYLELSTSRFQTSNIPAIKERQRLIYITDLDQYCILALLATVSVFQATFLRDFIDRNLAFRTFLGVNIPSTGFKKFALEFHLPYYAWRISSPTLANGPNQGPVRRSHPIRQSQEVRYLGLEKEISLGSTIRDQIFEAQQSILVTGVDDRFWTAYCFADIYFKDRHHTECAEYYHENELDPHSGGYVKEEWDNVISQLLRHIMPYADKIFAPKTNSTNAFTEDITQEEGYRWTIRVLRRFADHIWTTITRWEAFKSGEIRYFFEPGTDILADAAFGTHLAAVDKAVEELKELRERLQHQTNMFEKMTNSLATHAAVAENRTLIKQSNSIFALTVITIVFLPLNQASSIYSMQPAILPDAVGIIHYVATLIGLTIFTFILVSLITLPKAASKVQGILWTTFIKAPRNLYTTYISTGRGRSDYSGDRGLEMQDRSVRNDIGV